MPSFNRVILMGHLTRDPELKYTASGASLCKFGFAVNRKYKAGDEWKEEVCFIDITVWGRQAESCDKYLEKGKLALVEGRLHFNSWTSPDGQKKSKHDIVAESVKFLSSGQSNGQPSGQGDYALKNQQEAMKKPDDYPQGINDEEIPF